MIQYNFLILNWLFWWYFGFDRRKLETTYKKRNTPGSSDISGPTSNEMSDL